MSSCDRSSMQELAKQSGRCPPLHEGALGLLMLQALADIRQLPQQRLTHLVNLLQHAPSCKPLQHHQAMVRHSMVVSAALF